MSNPDKVLCVAGLRGLWTLLSSLSPRSKPYIRLSTYTSPLRASEYTYTAPGRVSEYWTYLSKKTLLQTLFQIKVVKDRLGGGTSETESLHRYSHNQHHP